MIPRIAHSRSQLHCHFNEYEDGARTFFVSRDTYPELLDILCSEIVRKSPTGWRTSKAGKMRYLWYPGDALTDADLDRLEDWKQHFEQYVLIGLNKHLEPFFSGELDFCMAIDFNRTSPVGNRTHIGEAGYQLKYQQSLPHFNTLHSSLCDAIGYLPLPRDQRSDLLFTNIPCDPHSANVGRTLAGKVAQSIGMDFARSDLLCDKTAMKDLPVDRKIPAWQGLYDRQECIELHGDPEGKTVVVIDDLYQSGATLWCYAQYLKRQGAASVIGLPCVKSLRDTDNQ